jgi:hypothetical protein
MSDFPLVWMADALRAAGCTVIEEDGWKTRGRPRSFAPIGIMFHHDASPKGETSNGVDVIRDGRPGLEGPLGNLWLAFDGTWHCVAAGSANHAGEGDGSWGDIDDGNHDTIGVETDHTTDEAWQPGQQSSGLRGTDALRRHMRMSDAQVHRRILAHKEWAPSRKVDPDPMDMNAARANLIAYDPAAEEEELVDQIRRVSEQEQTLAPGRWAKVRIGAEDDETGPQFGIVNGPCHFMLTINLTTDGFHPDSALMLRAVNTEADPDNVKSSHPIEQRSPTDDGPQHFAYAAQGWVPEGQTLRVQANPDTEVTISKAETRVSAFR